MSFKFEEDKLNFQFSFITIINWLTFSSNSSKRFIIVRIITFIINVTSRGINFWGRISIFRIILFNQRFRIN